MKPTSFIITGAIVGAIAICSPMTAFAASKKKDDASAAASPAASASPAAKSDASSEKPARAIAFRGTATAVDQSAKTFTIEGKTSTRVFKVGDQTAITKAGASATLGDLNANDAVTGSYWKQADGTLELKTLKIGGAGEGGGSKKAKKDADASAEPSPATSASPAAKKK